jgi:hypothetical protein
MHDILLKNNEYYGIRSIVNDYVFVIESSICFNVCAVCTVLYVLGPLLFLLTVLYNNFRKCTKEFDFHFFADEANLFSRNRIKIF